MAHFERERPDAQWYMGLTVPPAVLKNIDEKTKKAVSGTGGTYTPSAPVIIGGAGMDFQSAVQFSGAASVLPAAGKNYTFGDDDYFKYAVEQQFTIDDSPFLFGAHLDTQSRQAILTSSLPPRLKFSRPGARVRLPIRLPDGARLAEVNIQFKVGDTHSAVPEYLPVARVIRIDKSGVVEKYPTSAGISDPDGWSLPRSTPPSSGADWYRAGIMQTMQLPLDPASPVFADRSTYDYAVEWIDERGTGSYTNGFGNELWHVLTTYRTADLRPY